MLRCPDHPESEPTPAVGDVNRPGAAGQIIVVHDTPHGVCTECGLLTIGPVVALRLQMLVERAPPDTTELSYSDAPDVDATLAEQIRRGAGDWLT